MRFTLLTAFIATCLAATAVSADGDRTTYIVAFTKPVNDDTYKQARADIEASGGKVSHEIRSGLAGMIVELPSDQFNTFSSKPYIDFMEKDQEVHVTSN